MVRSCEAPRTASPRLGHREIGHLALLHGRMWHLTGRRELGRPKAEERKIAKVAKEVETGGSSKVRLQDVTSRNGSEKQTIYIYIKISFIKMCISVYNIYI